MTLEKAEESRGEGEEVGGGKWGEVRLKLRAGLGYRYHWGVGKKV